MDHAEPISGGLKYDAEKLPLHLIDTDAINGLAAVLDFGAKKYAPNNWRAGISYTRLIGAMLRHTFAILKGEDNDTESGLPHIDHVGCCWMFLSAHMKTMKHMDDRYSTQSKLVGDSTESTTFNELTGFTVPTYGHWIEWDGHGLEVFLAKYGNYTNLTPDSFVQVICENPTEVDNVQVQRCNWHRVRQFRTRTFPQNNSSDSAS